MEDVLKKVWMSVLSIVVLAPVVLFLLYFLLSALHESTDIGNGFEYVNSGRHDYYHIRKDEKIVIENSVVDLSVVGDYASGIRLPRCSNTHEQKIILSKKISYFILNTRTNEVLEFFSLSDFDDALKGLKLFDKVSLDYDRLNRLSSNLYKKYQAYVSKDQLSHCNNVEYSHLTS